jgi:hypothetical protein
VELGRTARELGRESPRQRHRSHRLFGPINCTIIFFDCELPHTARLFRCVFYRAWPRGALAFEHRHSARFTTSLSKRTNAMAHAATTVDGQVQTTNIPRRKVMAGGLAGSLTVVLVFILNTCVLPSPLPAEMASAITVVIGSIISYVTPPGENEHTV